MTFAFAENAAQNGAEFRFLTEVKGIEKAGEGYVLHTGREDIHARFVVNAAGVRSAEMHNAVSGNRLEITPRRGEYVLMDREVGGLVSSTIFQLPGKMGKGVLVAQTVHGNLLVGPNAVDVEDGEDTETTPEGTDEIKERAGKSVPDIPYNRVITGFAGVRAHEKGGDFIIGEIPDAEGFFDAAGIESPGLTAAPAIGEYLAGLVAEKAGAERKEDFISSRRGIPQVAKLSPEERSALIAERPEYGRIVCRCESISEGEIIDAYKHDSTGKELNRRIRSHRAEGNKLSSAWLIEQCGFKGKLLHGIRVSDKAPLVLINESAKSFDDLARARDEIISAVYDKFGYWLKQEPVEIINPPVKPGMFAGGAAQ